MGYYCDKEDCKCLHYYNHVCYIERCTYEEAKAFKCDIKPERYKVDEVVFIKKKCEDD